MAEQDLIESTRPKEALRVMLGMGLAWPRKALHDMLGTGLTWLMVALQGTLGNRQAVGNQQVLKEDSKR